MDEYNQDPDYEERVFQQDDWKDEPGEPQTKRSVHDANYRLTHKDQRRDYMRRYMAHRRKK